jgi:hypothetical protein
MPEDTCKDAHSSGGMDRPSLWWWLGQLLLTGIACFFVCFGIGLLVASYGLNDPYTFIMTFFAASLMILISVVMVLGFVLRMKRVMRVDRHENDKEADI